METGRAIDEEFLRRYSKGIRVGDVVYRCKAYTLRGPHSALITLTEGKNREIRNVFTSRNIRLKRVHRLRIGPVTLRGIPPGHFRRLNGAGGQVVLRRMVVAIDGPAGVGKSTVARRSAEAAGFLYINSGSFYRAITLAVLEAGAPPEDTEQVLDVARSCRLDLCGGSAHAQRPQRGGSPPHGRRGPLGGRALSDPGGTGDREREAAARSPRAGTWSWRAGTSAPWFSRRRREDLPGRGRRHPRRAAPRPGREHASRCRRSSRPSRARDTVDRNKPTGRLAAAPDAIRIDTSHLTIEQVCERVNEAILVRKNNPGDIR